MVLKKGFRSFWFLLCFVHKSITKIKLAVERDSKSNTNSAYGNSDIHKVALCVSMGHTGFDLLGASLQWVCVTADFNINTSYGANSY